MIIDVNYRNQGYGDEYQLSIFFCGGAVTRITILLRQAIIIACPNKMFCWHVTQVHDYSGPGSFWNFSLRDVVDLQHQKCRIGDQEICKERLCLFRVATKYLWATVQLKHIWSGNVLFVQKAILRLVMMKDTSMFVKILVKSSADVGGKKGFTRPFKMRWNCFRSEKYIEICVHYDMKLCRWL